MNVTHVPRSSSSQRDLYRLPRGPGRFEAYLATMLTRYRQEVALPLVAMNPMGKDHLPVFLDAALALDAEAVRPGGAAGGGRAPGVAGDFRLGVVVADNLLGG